MGERRRPATFNALANAEPFRDAMQVVEDQILDHFPEPRPVTHRLIDD